MKEKVDPITQNLREIRRSRGLTVNKLAEKMGEDKQKVGRIERGTRSLTIDYLMKVSKALDTPVESLIAKSPSAVPASPEQTSKLLSEIVVLIEKSGKGVMNLKDAEKKGALISKIYEEANRFSKLDQKQFIASLSEIFSFLDA